MWFVSWGHCTSHLFSPGSSSICPVSFLLYHQLHLGAIHRSRWFSLSEDLRSLVGLYRSQVLLRVFRYDTTPCLCRIVSVIKRLSASSGRGLALFCFACECFGRGIWFGRIGLPKIPFLSCRHEGELVTNLPRTGYRCRVYVCAKPEGGGRNETEGKEVWCLGYC
jgi:hypothetical protein